jgi:hypothetical protein
MTSPASVLQKNQNILAEGTRIRRKLASRFSDIMKAADWANSGDADSSANIQAGIDKAYSLGVPFVFTPGIWNVAGLYYYTGMEIYGVPGGVLKMNLATGFLLRSKYNPTVALPLDLSHRLESARIRYLEIDMQDQGDCAVLNELSWSADISSNHIYNLPDGTFSYDDGIGAATYPRSGLIVKGIAGVGGCYYGRMDFNHIRPALGHPASSATNAGIYVDASSSTAPYTLGANFNKFRDNRFGGFGTAIWISQGWQQEIEGNEVSASWVGIKIGRGDGTRAVSQCHIKRTYAEGCNIGIWLTSDSNQCSIREMESTGGTTTPVQDDGTDNAYFYEVGNVSTSPGGSVAAQARRNYTDNAGFELAQAGTSFAIAATTDTWTIDRYKTRRASTGMTVSRQTGFNGHRFCARVQRNNATTGTSGCGIIQQIPSTTVSKLAGRKVIFSTDFRTGANFSAASALLTIYIGTATDEAFDMASLAFPTGGANSGFILTAVPNTTGSRLSSSAYTIPSTALSLAWRISFTPVGTAGAADYFDIAGPKLEVGKFATSFEPEDVGLTFETVRPYFEKLGGDIADHHLCRGYADSTTHGFFDLVYGRKRITPTIAVVGTVGTDFELQRQGLAVVAPTAITATASHISERSCQIDATVAAGLTAGEGLGFKTKTTTGLIQIAARL